MPTYENPNVASICESDTSESDGESSTLETEEDITHNPDEEEPMETNDSVEKSKGYKHLFITYVLQFPLIVPGDNGKLVAVLNPTVQYLHRST